MYINFELKQFFLCHYSNILNAWNHRWHKVHQAVRPWGRPITLENFDDERQAEIRRYTEAGFVEIPIPPQVVATPPQPGNLYPTTASWKE